MLFINLHDLHPTPNSDWCFEPVRFRRVLEWLSSRGYRFVSPLESSSISFGELCCAFTFDDCRLGAYRFAPEILDSFGIKSLFLPVVHFLRSGSVPLFESYSEFMNEEQLLELYRAGHGVGSHGMKHIPYFYSVPEDISADLSRSKLALENLCGTAINSISIPYGQLSALVLQLARAAGYTTIFSVDYGWQKNFLRLPFLRRFDLRSSFSDAQIFDWITHAETTREAVSVADCGKVSVKTWDWPTIYRLRTFDLVVVGDEAARQHLAAYGLCHVLPADGRSAESAARSYLEAMFGLHERAMTVEKFPG